MRAGLSSEAGEYHQSKAVNFHFSIAPCFLSKNADFSISNLNLRKPYCLIAPMYCSGDFKNERRHPMRPASGHRLSNAESFPSLLYLPLMDRFATILIALLIFSPFGWRSLLKFGGNFYPEPILLLICIFGQFGPRYWRRAIRALALTRAFWIWSGVSFLLFGLGAIALEDPIAAYSDFRCIIIIGGAYCMVAKTQFSRLECLSISVNLAVFSIIFSIFAYIIYPPDVTSSKFSYPVLSVLFLLVVWGVPFRSPIKLILVTLSMAFMALTGFYRVNYVMAALVLSAVLLLLVTGARNGALGTRLNSAVILLSSFVFPTIFFTVLSDFIFDYLSADPSRYAQSIGKMENVLLYFQSGEVGGGDDVRLQYFVYITDHLSEFMLPTGFGSKAMLFNYGPAWAHVHLMIGSPLDGTHLFLLAHFGLVLSLILVVYVLLHIVRGLGGLYALDKIVCGLMLVAFLVYALATGAIFTEAHLALSAGLFLGILSRPLYRRDSRKLSHAVRSKRLAQNQST